MRLGRFRWVIAAASLPVVASALLWYRMHGSITEPDVPTREALEAFADVCWRPDGELHYILEPEWPAEVRRLKPQYVRTTPDGVYIDLRSLYVERAGLFVLPAGSSFRPVPGSDPSYTLLRGRVYRYHEKG